MFNECINVRDDGNEKGFLFMQSFNFMKQFLLLTSEKLTINDEE